MQPLQELLNTAHSGLSKNTNSDDACRYAIAPYRICPIGAHVDHQGGAVLGRSIDQYTVLAFRPLKNDQVTLFRSQYGESTGPDRTSFKIGSIDAPSGWEKYAQAAGATLVSQGDVTFGLEGYVLGTMVGAGLSSSASVILAYLIALADINRLEFSQTELVELVRQVENEHMGLNNGIQDQTAIAFGRQDALNHLDSRTGAVRYVANPANSGDVCWVIGYSGFSRNLLGSGFNTRVAECREAAGRLLPGAEILSDIPADQYEAGKGRLPAIPAKRAAHYFSEQARVVAGEQAWQAGDWTRFGQLMNRSCQSSIHQYESGSQPLIDLSLIAADIDGVYGARFSGGGYGGCVVALTERSAAPTVCREMIDQYLKTYPEKSAIAKAFVAEAEDGVRVV